MMKWMLALCLCVGIGCQTTQSASMDPLPVWEYKVERLLVSKDGLFDRDLTVFLNGMAEEGWELVEIYDVPPIKLRGVFRRRVVVEVTY